MASERESLVGKSLEIHYADSWAGLYVDGRLVQVGDSYVSEEQALLGLGVKLVQDDSFMRGGSQRADAAPTLDELEAWKRARDERVAAAEALEAQARELRAQADQLRAADPTS